jgi:hypothetical protein
MAIVRTGHLGSDFTRPAVAAGDSVVLVGVISTFLIAVTPRYGKVRDKSKAGLVYFR